MAGGIPVPVAAVEQPVHRPAPQQNTYQGREHLGGRVQGQFDGGPAVSGAVGAGMRSLAGGLGDLGDVWEKETQRRQNLEAMENIQEFQDKERLALEKMQELKGTEGYDYALQYMDDFYAKAGEKLLGRSRGQFQQQLYQKTVMQSRDMGMNKAMTHRIAELDRAEAAYYQGQVSREMQNIADDPNNAPFYLARAKENVARANQGVDNTAAFMELDASAKTSLKNNADTSFQALLISDPEAAMVMYEEGTKTPERPANLPDVSAKSKLTQEDLRVLSQDPNVRKTLDAISWAEGADYGTLVGGGQFSDFSRHPKKSVHIGRLGINSTAAGRYQFVGKTWDGLAKEFGFTDFSPETQDMAAIALLQRRGVLKDVLAGNWEKVVNSRGMSEEWASFPKNVYGQGGKSAGVLMSRLETPTKSEWADLFSPEELATMKKQATLAMDGKYISRQIGRYEQTLFVGTDQQQAQVVAEISNEISKVQDPERRSLMIRDLNASLSNIATINGANDMKAQEDFLALAGTEGWNAAQMLAQVDNIKGMTRDAREKLRQNIQTGTVNKETPENQAAYDAGLVMIDERRNAGRPMNAQEVQALAQQGGMTTGQSEKFERYRAEGGIAGQEGLAGKVNAAYKALARDKGPAPSGFVDMVARNLPPGKAATPDEIKHVAATLLLANVQGGSVGRGFLGLEKDETYAAAAKAGRAEFWLPDIIDDDEKSELTLQVQAGIESGMFPDAPINDEVLRDYKRVFVQGLPPRSPQGPETPSPADIHAKFRQVY